MKRVTCSIGVSYVPRRPRAKRSHQDQRYEQLEIAPTGSFGPLFRYVHQVDILKLEAPSSKLFKKI